MASQIPPFPESASSAESDGIPGTPATATLSTPDGIEKEASSEGDSEQPAAPSPKVEPDIEDAPFLEIAEPAAPEPPQLKMPAKDKEEKVVEQSRIKLLLGNKKLLIFLVTGLLALSGGGVFFLFFMGDSTAPAPSAPVPAGPRIVIVTPITNATGAALPYTTLIRWEPFIIPVKGTEGEVRLLRCTFSIPLAGKNAEHINTEMQSKKTILRDSVFYYLSRKPNLHINTEESQGRLKEDLISILNEHLTSDKLKDIYIEEYVIEGP